MKEYLFYTTEGYTEGADPGYPVENCQVLERASGNNPEETSKKLIEGNNWICKAGFTQESILFGQIVTPEMKHDVKEVIQYFGKMKKNIITKMEILLTIFSILYKI